MEQSAKDHVDLTQKDAPSYKIPALILAGGLGTRLRSIVNDRPKPMALIRGKPFLHWLIWRLGQTGYRRFIFSVGFQGNIINDYPWKTHFPQFSFQTFLEKEQLGTGGATRAVFNAFPDLEMASVINGDTLLENPLPPGEFADLAHYTALRPQCIFDAQPNVFVQDSFVKSLGDGGQIFDGGQVFVRRQAVTRDVPPDPCSLHQLLLKFMGEQKVGYSLVDGTCYDIGTPERLARFENYLNKIAPI